MRASNSPHQIGRSSSPSGCDTVASSGADKELATNHREHQSICAHNGHAICLPVTPSLSRIASRHSSYSPSTKRTPNVLRSTPILIAPNDPRRVTPPRDCSLSMLAPEVALPRLWGLFPNQARQDKREWLRNVFPIIRPQIPVLASIQRVVQFLSSLVIHDPESVTETGEKHGNSVGEFKNDRGASSVRNSSKANSASGPLPVSGRAHPPRF